MPGWVLAVSPCAYVLHKSAAVLRCRQKLPAAAQALHALTSCTPRLKLHEGLQSSPTCCTHSRQLELGLWCQVTCRMLTVGFVLTCISASSALPVCATATQVELNSMADPLAELQQRSAAEALEYLGWAAPQLVRFSDLPEHTHSAVTAQALVDAGEGPQICRKVLGVRCMFDQS
jgi:hypothetical protein